MALPLLASLQEQAQATGGAHAEQQARVLTLRGKWMAAARWEPCCF